ncbi:MAG: flavodoxin [Candidatus Saccharibacteria bacterium]|nr:flavodoxin [Candidatus Saccharibacteria bacterium]
MKTLIVCDSNFGNTKLIALEIAKSIGEGAKVILTKDFKESDLNAIDLLIFGSPINGWRPSEKTLEVLVNLKGKLKKDLKFATFDTRVKLFIHGDAKEKMAEMLRAAGGKRVFESQAFYVKGKQGPLFPGELEKAANWAKLLKSKM